VFVVSWIGADACDHRLARLPTSRAANREHLSVGEATAEGVETVAVAASQVPITKAPA
jgi:hypothetical protein